MADLITRRNTHDTSYLKQRRWRLNLIMSSKSRFLDVAKWAFFILNEAFARTGSKLWIASLLSFVATICSVGALILPLKIILLIASDGVPRYFENIVSVEGKDAWIFGLSAVTLLLYVASLLAESRVEENVRAALKEVSRKRPSRYVIRNETERTVNIYTRMCRLSASAAIAIAMATTGLLANALVFVCLLSLLLFEVVVLDRFADFAQSETRAGSSGDNARTYISVFVPVNFLVFFLIILAIFLFGSGMNAFLAIVSVVVGRQMLSSTKTVFNELFLLGARRDEVQRVVLMESPPDNFGVASEASERALTREARDARLARILGVAQESIVSVWCDSGRSDLYVFDVRLRKSEISRFREYLYPETGTNSALNESLLLQHVESARLHIPFLEAQYDLDQFAGRLFRVPPSAQRPLESEWSAMRTSLLVESWFVQPTPELLAAYLRSGRLLPDRLSDHLVSTLEVSIDGCARRTTYQMFLERLPDLVDQLRAMPLFVFHGPLDPEHVLVADSIPIVMDWGNWSIETVGAGLRMGHDDQEQALADFRRLDRNDLMLDLTEGQLRLACHCWNLEGAIRRQRHDPAHELIAEIVQLIDA